MAAILLGYVEMKVDELLRAKFVTQASAYAGKEVREPELLRPGHYAS